MGGTDYSHELFAEKIKCVGCDDELTAE